MDLVVRGKIQKLIQSMLRMPAELHVHPEVKHHFAPGMYGREMCIPAGTTIVGKIHRHSHPNYIASGRVLISTEEGEAEVQAPAVFQSPVGTQRVVHALEDTVWITYHKNPTDTQDLAELERSVIAPSYEALEQKESV